MNIKDNQIDPMKEIKDHIRKDWKSLFIKHQMYDINIPHVPINYFITNYDFYDSIEYGEDSLKNSEQINFGNNCRKCNIHNEYIDSTIEYVCYSCKH